MKNENNIEQLFNEKFNSFEPNVDPNIWNNIQNNLGNGSSASVGTLAVSNVVVGVSMAVATIVGVVSTNAVITQPKPNTIIQEVVAENKKQFNNNFTKNIEELAKTDDVVRTNIKEISNPSEITKEQKEVVEKVLEKPFVESTETAFVPEETTNGVPKDLVIPTEPTIVNEVTESVEATDNVSNSKDEESPKVNTTESTTTVESAQSNIEERETVQSQIIKVPNVFTPNGDFRNDFYQIESVELKSIYVVIADQKGNYVFESSDVDFKWDGNDKYGNPAADGNYILIIKAQGNDGVAHTKSERIYLKR